MIDRLYGIYDRFQQLQAKLETSLAVIEAVFILHNVALYKNEADFEEYVDGGIVALSHEKVAQ